MISGLGYTNTITGTQHICLQVGAGKGLFNGVMAGLYEYNYGL